MPTIMIVVQVFFIRIEGVEFMENIILSAQQKRKKETLKDLKRVLLLSMLTITAAGSIKTVINSKEQVVLAEDYKGLDDLKDVKEKESKVTVKKEKEKDEMPHLSMHTEEMKRLGNVAVIKDDITSILETFSKASSPAETYQALKPYIEKMSEKYAVPFDLIVTIIHQESGGNWNTNGFHSYTDDYGLTQINECNLAMFQERLGFSREDILYNPCKAIEAEAFQLKSIMDMYNYDMNVIDYKNVCGTYNGWINWRDNEMSSNYADSCMNIIEQDVDKTFEKTK